MKSGPVQSSVPSWTMSLVEVLCRYAIFIYVSFSLNLHSLISSALLLSSVSASFPFLFYFSTFPSSLPCCCFFPLRLLVLLAPQVIGAPITTQVLSHPFPASHLSRLSPVAKLWAKTTMTEPIGNCYIKCKVQETLLSFESLFHFIFCMSLLCIYNLQ